MTFKTLAACAFASLAMTATASAGWIDDYNAKLNTPAAQAATAKAACASTAPIDQTNCTYYKKYGAPVSDVRYGIVVGSLIVGGVVGGALHAHPGVFGHHGHLHILGWKPTFAGAVAAGAATGAGVAYVTTR